MKVGDYVRTEISSLNLQRIGKIKKIISEDFIHTDIGTYDKKNIIKSSPNIIDLIEEDDFINGSRITELKSNKNGVIKCMLDSDYEFITTITNEEIESVVTKEQFSQMEYRIEEK